MANEQQRGTVVVFAGAGASKAVDPDRFPTTVDFFELLPEEITENLFFQHITSFLQQENEDGQQIDIENILWTIDDLKEHIEKSSDLKHISGWFMNTSYLAHAVQQHNASMGTFSKMAPEAIQSLSCLKDDVNKQVYSLYDAIPKTEKIEENWIFLLEILLKKYKRVELVTTNYDLVLETAIQEVRDRGFGSIAPGWKDRVLRLLDIELWTSDEKRQSHQGVLTKLHGSINWTKYGNGIYVSDPSYRGAHDKHAIIYPGNKGVADHQPFRTLHEYFKKIVCEAHAMIFIGFAFRDQHINDLCNRNLLEGVPIAVIDIDPNIQIPISGPGTPRVQHLQSGFDRESISKAFKYIQKYTPF
ncbi:MAG: SIR2 family protein [Firmicutes bacterium]|nr:SIR2 family protein [Bacillota bacterium]